MIEERPLIYKYLRHDKKFPHVWCGGCGIGIMLGSLIRAIDHIGYTKDEVVLVSGIGCSGRLPVYVDFNTLHTTHGRALTFATGVKLAKPELHVIVIMGDGDATAIGGNHFIHAARRNLDLTAIIVNNSIYGMTGGQYSPTTPYGQRATTAIYGSVEHSFNISQLAVCAGAIFVARGIAGGSEYVPTTGTLLGVKGLVAALVVGFASPGRAYAAGLGLGVVEAAIASGTIAGHGPGPAYREVLPLAFALLLLAARGRVRAAATEPE